MNHSEQFIKQRNRHAAGFANHSQIIDLLAERLIERLDLVTLTPAHILDIGSISGHTCTALSKRFTKARIYGIEPALTLTKKAHDQRRWFSKLHYLSALPFNLPFADNSLDLIIANVYPVWLADPKKMLADVARVLTPNGLFLFSSLGPDSLTEIKRCWSRVDRGHEHTEQFIDMHDIGDALTASGFHSIVMENEPLTVTYSKVQEIHEDLRATGYANLHPERRKTLTAKGKFQHYMDLLQATANPDIAITLDVVFGHGWKGTQKPKYPIHSTSQETGAIPFKAIE